jgi:surface protein
MESLFSNCISLISLDIQNFNVSSVETMAYMLNDCKLMISLHLPDFSSLSVKNVSHMFSDCSTLTSLEIPNFDSKGVICMDYMFSGCRFLSSLNINNLKTENVIDMKFMFAGCSSLVSLNLNSFNTDKVKFMNGMFYGCESLTFLDITNFNTEITENMSFMFNHVKSILNLDLSRFNTNNLKYIHYMFEGCESLRALNILHFSVYQIKIFDGLFSGCSKLISLDLSNFETKNAKSMRYMFNGCNSLKNIIFSSNFNTSLVTSFKNMFSGCNSLQSLDISNFNTSNVVTMEYLFADCSSLRIINLENFDTTSVTSMDHMFDGCKSLISINFGRIITSSVNTMEYMFSGCSSLRNIDITPLDVSSVTSMEGMFEKCISLTTLDLSTFNSGSIQNVKNMFSDDINLVYINLTNFDESSIIQTKNIFEGTLENIGFCFNETFLPKINKLIKKKECSFIDCSDNWIKSRKKIIAKTNQCVDKCPEGFIFAHDYKCYYRCPEGTYPDDFHCKASYNFTENDTCTIKSFFLELCELNLDTIDEKRKFIEDTVSSIVNGSLYDIIIMAIDFKQIFTIKQDTEVYQIYALQSKSRDPNLTFVDFTECGNILKKFNRILEDDDIIIFKIEYTYPDFKIPIIEYTLFSLYGTKRLTLYSCSDITITYYIPRLINDFEDYKYNPENKYYVDNCIPSSSNDKTDLALIDRKIIFNQNNMSLCESTCVFKGYINNNIICDCQVKEKFNSFLNTNIDKYGIIYRFKQPDSNIFNFWVLKCYLNLLNKNVVINNYCSIIILGIIFVTLISAFIFCLKEHDILNNKIFTLIELIRKEEETEKNIKKNNDINSSKSKIIDKGTKKINLLKNKKISETLSKDINSKNDLILKNNNTINNINNNDIMINQGNNYIIPTINIENNIVKELRIKECEGRTDNELNFFPYFDALLNDQRTLTEIYFSLIKTNQILFFSFSCKNDFNPRTMKLCFFLYIFSIFLMSNTIFITDSTLHDLYISKGKIKILSEIPVIIYTTIISGTIKNILLLISFPESDILKIRRFGTQPVFKLNQGIQKSINMVIFRCYLYFFISIITLIFIWIYIAIFFTIFHNTQLYVIINTLISFGLSLIVPFIVYIFPALIRKSSLKSQGSQSSYCFYVISGILQVIL